LPQDVRERVGRHEGKQLIAGVRPESFEDAALTGEARDRGMTFNAHIEVVESMGSELYAHFTVDTDQSIESAELRELAEDAGGGEVPSAGEEGRIVARLDPGSGVSEGEGAELWVDATRVILFDPDDGRNLTTEQKGPAATGGQDTSGREPEPSQAGGDSDAEAPPGATGGTR
jgi:multiple sugar transport system ATP-binding protein